MVFGFFLASSAITIFGFLAFFSYPYRLRRSFLYSPSFSHSFRAVLFDYLHFRSPNIIFSLPQAHLSKNPNTISKMKTFTSLALTFSSLLASVSAHGYIVSPPRRTPGAEMSAVCGQTIYNNQASDNAGPIQLLLQSASSIVDTNSCNLWLCKGYQFADNTAQVQTYSLGQTIDMEVKIVAPHTGYANVSIVDTKTNAIKGSFLKSWDVYASTATGVTADETNFSVTIPTDLTGCTTAGGIDPVLIKCVSGGGLG